VTPYVLVIEPVGPSEGPDVLVTALKSAGLRTRRCTSWAADDAPDALDGIAALVVLDGPTTAGALPAEAPQRALLHEALQAELPVLVLGRSAGLLPPTARGWAWGLPAVTEPDRNTADAFAALVARRAARRATRTFFTPRAATWEARFAGDGPRYAAAVRRMGLRPGQRALDVGCGSGRALPPLRAEVGAEGVVVGVDLTPAMLTATAREGRTALAALLLADACALPLPGGAVDGVFSAGLLNHVPDPVAALREWARVTAPGGVLLLYHPSGRTERAARHGRPLSPDDPLADHNLLPALKTTGWHPTCYEDAPHHFLTHAIRTNDEGS
jgi:SAM-dependent methyltransferase